jgi:hypothetical protein
MNPVEKERLAGMFHAIFTSCTEVAEETLARYAELEMAGQEPDKQLPEVGAHLDECPDCAGRYAELLSMLQAEARGEVSATLLGHSFDLRFLSPPWVEVKETFCRLMAEIPLVVQRAMAAFGPLPSALAPCRVSVSGALARDTAEAATEIETLQIPDESADLLFTLMPGPVDEHEKGVTLVLKLETLQAGEPLGQVRVNLCDAQGQLLQSKVTTADGQVVFRGLVENYILRCQYAGRTWDLPLKLQSDVALSEEG